MSKSATNITIILGLMIIAASGYYLYSQKSATTLQFTSNPQNLQDMLQRTRIFIDRDTTLQKVELDTNFFENERIPYLKSFRTDIKKTAVGRDNPFANTELTAKLNSQ